MNAAISNRPASAFTLIELVISAGVGAMILAGAYFCLSAGIASQKMIDPRVDLLQSARVSMALISTDLRAACPLDNNFAFLGMHRTIGEFDADNIDFATHNYTAKHDQEADYCEVSYFVRKDPKSGLLSLWRRRNPTLAEDPLSGGRREEIARGLKGVRFEYTDGYDWYDTWGETNSEKMTGLIAQSAANLSGMPEAVRVTLSYPASPETATNAPPLAKGEHGSAPPMVFQTIVGLELADSSSQSLSDSGDTSSPTDNQNGQNGGPSGPTPGGMQ